MKLITLPLLPRRLKKLKLKPNALLRHQQASAHKGLLSPDSCGPGGPNPLGTSCAWCAGAALTNHVKCVHAAIGARDGETGRSPACLGIGQFVKSERRPRHLGDLVVAHLLVVRDTLAKLDGALNAES